MVLTRINAVDLILKHMKIILNNFNILICIGEKIFADLAARDAFPNPKIKLIFD